MVDAANTPAPVTPTTSTTSTSTTQTAVQNVPGIVPVPGASLGAYLSYEEFVLRFQAQETVQLSQPKVTNPASADRPRVEASLKDASDLIDSYLRARYADSMSVLHTSPSGTLKRHAANIARYELAQNRATEQMRDRYEDAIKWCEFMLKDGKSLTLSNGTTVRQTDSSGGDVVTDDVVYRDEAYSTNNAYHSSTESRVRSRHTARRYGVRGY